MQNLQDLAYFELLISSQLNMPVFEKLAYSGIYGQPAKEVYLNASKLGLKSSLEIKNPESSI